MHKNKGKVDSNMLLSEFESKFRSIYGKYPSSSDKAEVIDTYQRFIYKEHKLNFKESFSYLPE